MSESTPTREEAERAARTIVKHSRNVPYHGLLEDAWYCGEECDRAIILCDSGFGGEIRAAKSVLQQWHAQWAGWIKTADRRPAERVKVLVSSGIDIDFAWIDGDRWDHDNFHRPLPMNWYPWWRPLPALPETLK